MSPKLFTLALKDIFNELNWDEKGINIDSTTLSYLRFTDDIAVIANNSNELQEMLNQLNVVSARVGLKMNFKKTKLISPEGTNIEIGSNSIERVDEYIYVT